ncbi:MAG: hypothetical protein KKB51_09130, partial [Candidatus Riflebacteria bacterium]|nr:hypothetical protein [Candidatus Riflebacteria bacterium]
MKNTFRGYYKLSEDEFKTLWGNALFVFDTNVLLNLYRYQPSTRDALLTVITKLAKRVWIPYHVGLEYQRNRLKVISAQHKRFTEVKNIISKAISKMQGELDHLQLKNRHSHINPEALIENIEKTKSEFFSKLEELEKKSISLSSKDEIRIIIDKLFDAKIGLPPENQVDIDSIFKEAEERYKKSIPPGFEDSCKDEKSPDEFS